MRLLHIIAVISIALINASVAYKILALVASTAKSHFIVYAPMLKELARRGHEVHVVSNFPLERPIEGYVDLSLAGIVQHKVGFVRMEWLPTEPWLNFYFTHGNVLKLNKDLCESALKSDVITYIKQQQYDLVLTEYFMSNCLLGVIPSVRAPIVGLVAADILPWFTDYLGVSDNPSYIEHPYTHYKPPMGFFGRVGNTLAYMFTRWYYNSYFVTTNNAYGREYFGENNIEMYGYNTSLFLINRHNSVHNSRPLPPNAIEVGGMHLHESKRVPANIEKWINESEAGVIYFSMGSMIKGHTFPEDKRRAFLRAFGRLKQRVLWKWENETMPEQPDNVMIQKWMPQFDILCHPNVKAFISHGGLLGTTEAVHCGVPVLAMPQFGDQHTNAKALEASGGGVVLDFDEVTEDSVFAALQTILTPEFNKQAKELSFRFRDRPMSPMDTAIYWIEYVARHKGAHHMRTAAVGMPFYQYHLLDVIAFLAAILIVMLWVSYYITKTLWNKLCHRRQQQQQQQQKKVKKN